MRKKSELINNEAIIEFMQKYYPFYSNSMLCMLIKKEYGIKLKTKDIEKIVYEMKKRNGCSIKPKYPVLLRKKILEKIGLPQDPTNTPNMEIMRLSKHLVITKCMNILNSIKNRKNVKSIEEIKNEKIYINYKDMGGRQPTVIKYLCNVGVLRGWGKKTYMCEVEKMLALIEELKKIKDNFVEVYNGGNNGGKRNREVAREN